MLRSELQRPGQSLVDLADRVKLMVRSIANANGIQQEPEYAYNATNVDDFYLVGSIGRERFQMAQDKCAGEMEDWEQIKKLQKRDLFDRHRRRFDGCGTAELARRALSELALTSDDPIEAPVAVLNRRSASDRLAARSGPARRPRCRACGKTRLTLPSRPAPRRSRTTSGRPLPYNLGRAYQSSVAAGPRRGKRTRRCVARACPTMTRPSADMSAR